MKSLIVNDAKNPRWADVEHTSINLDVDFDHLDEIYVPFTASLSDTEIHGQELFVLAANGEFGPVAEYVPPPAPSVESCLAQIDAKAEQVRLRYITPGAGQAATYILKQMQAEAFKAAGYAGQVPALVQAEASATGESALAACDRILLEAALWSAKGAQIEEVRRTWKIAIAVSVDRTADLAAAQAALDAL